MHIVSHSTNDTFYRVSKGRRKKLLSLVALLAQKLRIISFCQDPFPAILRQKKQKQIKVVMATKPRGGGW